MLTRLAIASGHYLKTLADVPADIRWTQARIERSMRDLLACQDAAEATVPQQDVWLFGYGSLIWNPLTNHAERRTATLPGWHRRFCQRLVAGRADADAPGRMLGLRPGGQTGGVAYRLPFATLEAELRLVWIREMAMGAYRPIWAPVEFDDGTQAHAIVFVADETHPFYEADSNVETVAPLIAEASGPWGSNAQYLFDLAAALLKDGMHDSYIAHLVARVRGQYDTEQQAA